MPTLTCQVCQKQTAATVKQTRTLLRNDHFICGSKCLLKKLSFVRSKDTFLPEGTKYNEKSEDDSGLVVWSAMLRMSFRSNGERQFAEWCKRKHIRFVYEPFMIPVRTSVVIPDFYLMDYKTLVEIKGMWSPGGKQKTKHFVEENPKIRYIILTPAVGWDYGKGGGNAW